MVHGTRANDDETQSIEAVGRGAERPKREVDHPEQPRNHPPAPTIPFSQAEQEAILEDQLSETNVGNAPSLQKLREAAEYSPKQQHAPKTIERPPGQFVKFGPFEVRPGINQEVPIGRAYQPMPISSVSRLHAFIGRDQHSLYIREVPDNPNMGLRPSKNGVWVKQAADETHRRLASGAAERIYPDTDVRVGGDGETGSSGFQVDVY